MDTRGESTMADYSSYLIKTKPYGAGSARGFPFGVSLRRECQASLLAFLAGCRLFSAFNVLGDHEMILVMIFAMMPHKP
jgi:hypothetical protein